MRHTAMLAASCASPQAAVLCMSAVRFRRLHDCCMQAGLNTVRTRSWAVLIRQAQYRALAESTFAAL